MLGIDYSFARPGAAAIKAAGFQFVCRYLASSSTKRISSAEVADLQSNDLPIVLVFEDYANQALNGFNQGVADAKEALTQADAIGFPASRPIYFAVDFDATEAQQAPIDDYLKGVASVIGADRVGVYGGFYVVQRCSQNGTAKWFWQAVAWSGGQQFAGNHIYQNGDSAFAGGADVDEAKQSDYGQWPEGNDMPTICDLNQARILAFFILGWGTDAIQGKADAELKNNAVGRPLDAVVNEFYLSPDGQAHQAKMLAADPAYVPYSGADLFIKKI